MLRQTYDNQIGFESRDSIEEGLFISHHQKDAAMLHGTIHPSNSYDYQTPGTAQILSANRPVRVDHGSEPESQGVG